MSGNEVQLAKAGQVGDAAYHSPQERVSVDQFDVEGYRTAAPLVVFNGLFVLPLEVCGNTALPLDQDPSLGYPARGFLVQPLPDQLESSFELGIEEFTLHGVSGVFKRHPGERLALGDPLALGFDRREIGVVVPQEPSFAQVLKGFKRSGAIQLGQSVAVLGFRRGCKWLQSAIGVDSQIVF